MNQSEAKTCQNCKNQFIIEPDDVGFYNKLEVPFPEYCPECRMQRRLAHRNERTLYRRACDLCKKDIIAIYPPGTSWPVFCSPCWWSDGWDAKTYALSYNPAVPFFDQFLELQSRVPRIGLLSINSTNSEYTNNSADNKNCYLLFAAENCEDCVYGRLIQHCKSVVDGCFVYDSELCYGCIDCHGCYNCLFSERCQASTDLLFCLDVRDSNNCILSTNLRHKSYCIENKQYTKEEYEKKKKEILSSFENIESAKRRLVELKGSAIVKFAFQTKCANATGDYLYNCHSSRMMFDARNSKNCAYMADVEDPIDCRDGNNIYYKPELCVDVMGALQIYRSKFSAYIFYSNELEYCDNCHNAEYCFGSTGLKKAKHCILNKEYSKEDYDRLRKEIVEKLKKEGTYGSFLPPSVSPFGYNETLAKDFWQLSKEEALAKGFRWQDTQTGTSGKETIGASAMPNTIEGVGDTILNEILVCIECGRNFRITPAELQFYRRMHLPLPRRDFECRHQARMKKRNPRKLWERSCNCAGSVSDGGKYRNESAHLHGKNHCPNVFKTSYSPERPEIVYCESCYQAEVV